MGLAVVASHSWTDNTEFPAAIVLPSGLNVNELPRCLEIMGRPMGRPVVASQSRAILAAVSSDVSTDLPSGLKSPIPTLSSWTMGGAMDSPVRTSRSRVTSGGDALVSIVLPSGLNANTTATPPVSWAAR